MRSVLSLEPTPTGGWDALSLTGSCELSRVLDPPPKLLVGNKPQEEKLRLRS